MRIAIDRLETSHQILIDLNLSLNFQNDLIFPDGPGQHPTRPEEEHKKFANYGFDKKEFIRIVKQVRFIKAISFLTI